MPLSLQSLRLAALSTAIALGFIVQSAPANARDTQQIVVAGGCFWCVESDFESVPGVSDVVSGYAGGTAPNPTYDDHEGYTEAVRITYDADRIGTEALLGLFFRSIDPTDAGGQFCDRGPSYTTAIFVTTTAQQAAAEAAKAEAQAALGQNIVTPIRGNPNFAEAEAYHQDYYRGSSIVLTRRGPKSQAEAYKFYRNACGRDARVQQLWGSAAPFVGH
jgi:peptide-methionine (S)-S-oxide reductase